MSDKAFKSPSRVGKAPEYIPQTPTYFDNVLLGLAQIKKRKDKAPEQDILIAERFIIDSQSLGGNEQAFTCPAGKRAYISVLTMNAYHIEANGLKEHVLKFTKKDGTKDIIAKINLYYQFDTQVIVLSPPNGLVLEEGEGLEINPDGNNHIYLNGFGYYYPL
jgi:hypothetical protein